MNPFREIEHRKHLFVQLLNLKKGGILFLSTKKLTKRSFDKGWALFANSESEIIEYLLQILESRLYPQQYILLTH